MGHLLSSLQLTVEVMYWAALAPLFYLLIWRKNAASELWMVALAFAASWFADSAAYLLDGSWSVIRWLGVVQLSLFMLASGSVVGPSVLLAIAAIPTAAESPDMLVTGIGSAMAVGLSHSKDFGPSLALYCGVGTIFYLLLVTELSTGRFMPLWYCYQFCRLGAFAAFIRTARGYP